MLYTVRIQIKQIFNTMVKKSKNYQSPALDYESPVLMIMPVCSAEFGSASLIGRNSVTDNIEEGDYEDVME